MLNVKWSVAKIAAKTCLDSCTWRPLPFVRESQATLDLSSMSIEELAQIEVTSVSKSAQPISDAPSAIYVITHDDIVRSGALILPEMLRLAPNLQVAQTSANAYVITARGFSGSPAAQNLPNKLLVLIDGRSVYTPLYSGVYWDMQDVLPDDIDRIEVISGPGATLWGANAVNGVINVITRKAKDTSGAVATADVGADERAFGLRYGGNAGETLAYRLYVHGYEDDQTKTAAGIPGQDDWWRVQGGFQIDWTASASDDIMLQGNAYGGSRSQFAQPDEDIRGRNLLLRWNRSSESGSALQVQTYYDRTERDTDGSGFTIDTYDLEFQHSFAIGSRNDIVWGGGIRVSHHNLRGVPQFFFVPARRTLTLGNAFVQDTIRISDALNLILGLKVEDDPLFKRGIAAQCPRDMAGRQECDAVGSGLPRDPIADPIRSRHSREGRPDRLHRRRPRFPDRKTYSVRAWRACPAILETVAFDFRLLQSLRRSAQRRNHTRHDPAPSNGATGYADTPTALKPGAITGSRHGGSFPPD